MKIPHYDFIKYKRWKEQFIKDFYRITPEKKEKALKELENLYPQADERLLMAVLFMYLGGHEKRIEDPEVRYWATWACIKTYETFNSFPQLSNVALSFLFYAIGKVFIPLLLHERGVKSESFKSLPFQEQERVVMEELEVIWKNHLIKLLQILPLLDLNSVTM